MYGGQTPAAPSYSEGEKMMTDIQIFQNEQFGEVRTILEGETLLFCGSDVARALGYAIPSKAVHTHCKGVSKMEAPSRGGTQTMLFIPEGDVYRLIVRSKLPAAEKFEHWLFDEVVPTIRKTGMYATPATVEAMLANPDTMIQVLQAFKDEREQRLALQMQAIEDAPKVAFADAVETSTDSCLVGQLAKIIRQNGYEIGANRLFEYLRKEGYLCKAGSNRNMPTQRSMEAGWFEVKESVLENPDGSIRVVRTPKVTGKGQIFFVNKFLRPETVRSETVPDTRESVPEMQDTPPCHCLDAGIALYDASRRARED